MCLQVYAFLIDYVHCHCHILQLAIRFSCICFTRHSKRCVALRDIVEMRSLHSCLAIALYRLDSLHFATRFFLLFRSILYLRDGTRRRRVIALSFTLIPSIGGTLDTLKNHPFFRRIYRKQRREKKQSFLSSCLRTTKVETGCTHPHSYSRYKLESFNKQSAMRFQCSAVRTNVPVRTLDAIRFETPTAKNIASRMHLCASGA